MIKLLFFKVLCCKMLPLLFVFCYLCQKTGALFQTVTDIVESSNQSITAPCNWECVVVESADFVPEMKVLVGNYRIVSLHLTLRKYVDNSCLNQMAVLSSSRLAKSWIWSTVSTHVKNVFYQPGSDGSSGILFSKSVEGQIEGKVACTFNLSRDQPTQQLYSSLNDLIAKVLMEEVGESKEVWQFEAALCYKEREQTGLYVCLTFNNKTKDTTGTPPPKKTFELPVRARSGCIILILVFSILFFPAVVCFFSPTYVSGIQNQAVELELIVLDGPSHTSIRGCISNIVSIVSSKLSIGKFFLILIISWIVILGLLLVLHLLSVYPDLDMHAKEFTVVTVVLLLMLSSLWCIRGVFRVFLPRLSFLESCFVCDYVEEEETDHQALGLEEEIRQHLQIQPMIMKKCGELFCVFLEECWRICCTLQLECKWRAIRAIGLFLSMVIAIVVSLIVCLVLYLVLVFYSCPMSSIFDFYAQLFIANSDGRCMSSTRIFLLSFFLVFPGGIAVGLLLLMSASIFIKASTIILSIENIASFTLIVLCISYCSRCYNSFTSKYDDLAAKLYSRFKKRVQENNQPAQVYLKHNNKKAIPKDLFDALRQENMPLGGNICKLLLRIFIICAFFSLVYKIVTGTPGVPERIMTTFLVVVSPMIVEIVMLKKSDEMEELKQEEMNEKIQLKVDEYIEAIPPNQQRLHDTRERGRSAIDSRIGIRNGTVEAPTTALPSAHDSGNARSVQIVTSL